MSKIRRKQDWEVTLFITETEGDETTTQPWYSPQDISNLLRDALLKAGKMRDFKVESFYSTAVGDPYYPGTNDTEIPF